MNINKTIILSLLVLTVSTVNAGWRDTVANLAIKSGTFYQGHKTASKVTLGVATAAGVTGALYRWCKPFNGFVKNAASTVKGIASKATKQVKRQVKKYVVKPTSQMSTKKKVGIAAAVATPILVWAGYKYLKNLKVV